MLTRILFLVLLGLATVCNSEEIRGKVVGVADGDTITVLDERKVQHKVRLAGIDAPEKAQAFGQRSKKSLSELVFQKTVTIETTKRDRYGRHVGKVLLGDRDVNLEQLKRGVAWYYRKYANELATEDRRLYDMAEVEARGTRLGLWVDPSPTPPWEYRRQ